MDLTGKCIKDYANVFECSFFSRVKGDITWTKWPVARSSLAYRRLMGTSAGHAAFAVFVGLVRLCARLKTGGLLSASGVAFTVADIHGETGIPARMIPPALLLLSSEAVGWVLCVPAVCAPCAPKAPDAHTTRTPRAAPSVSVFVSESVSSLQGVQGETSASKEPGPFYLADALAMVSLPVLEGIGDLWSDWMRIRFSAQRHKRPTRRAAEIALKKLEGWEPAKRRQALEDAVGGSWQGLYEPKGIGNGQAGHRQGNGDRITVADQRREREREGEFASVKLRNVYHGGRKAGVGDTGNGTAGAAGEREGKGAA